MQAAQLRLRKQNPACQMFATTGVAPASKHRLPMTLRWFVRYAVLASLSFVPAASETAADEQVCIRKVVGNKAILARGERDFYLVQTSAACPSLAHQEGRTVMVRSPGGFLGPQSGLVLANQKQPCSIARAAALFSNAAVSVVDSAAGTGSLAIEEPQALLALQEALMLLEHDPGAVGSKTETLKVVNEIRKQYGNEPTEEGLRKTVVLMALQVVSRNPNDGRAKGVSRKLLDMALGSDSSKIQP
jgi:hypothetical protein